MTTTTTPDGNAPGDELDAIKARRSDITPGDWYDDKSGFVKSHFVEGNLLVCATMKGSNRRFIAHAPTDIDTLLARVAALEAERVAPTPDEVHRYAVAWGGGEVAHLTDWRYWEQKQNEVLEIVRRQAVEIERLEAELATQRSRTVIIGVDTRAGQEVD